MILCVSIIHESLLFPKIGATPSAAANTVAGKACMAIALGLFGLTASGGSPRSNQPP